MRTRRLAFVALLVGLFASGAQAQIKHIEMRVEGMT